MKKHGSKYGKVKAILNEYNLAPRRRLFCRISLGIEGGSRS